MEKGTQFLDDPYYHAEDCTFASWNLVPSGQTHQQITLTAAEETTIRYAEIRFQ